MYNNNHPVTNGQSGTSPRILVTGASRGIGRAIAIECARRGGIVGANFFRSSEDARSLKALFPDNIQLLPFDVRDLEAVQRAISSFAEREGGIDILINNAGVGARPQFLVKVPQKVINEIIGVNLLGSVNCTHAVLPTMMRARSGQIIFISSIAAVAPTEGVTVYAASKSGCEGLAVAVAKEYARRGIRAVGVRFGMVRTDMTRELIAHAEAAGVSVDPIEPETVAVTIADMIFGRTCYGSGQIVEIPVNLAEEVPT